jgi:hypothetical protein
MMAACGEREVDGPEFSMQEPDGDIDCAWEFGEEYAYDEESGECYNFLGEEEEGGTSGGRGGGAGGVPGFFAEWNNLVCDPGIEGCVIPLEPGDISKVLGAFDRATQWSEGNDICERAVEASRDIYDAGQFGRGADGIADNGNHEGKVVQLGDGTEVLHIDGDALDVGNEALIAYIIVHEGMHTLDDWVYDHPDGDPPYAYPFSEANGCLGYTGQ